MLNEVPLPLVRAMVISLPDGEAQFSLFLLVESVLPIPFTATVGSLVAFS